MSGAFIKRRTMAALLVAVVVLGTFGSIEADAQRRGGRRHSGAKGALIGGIIGAVGGGLIGGRKGTVIGAGLGAGTGYLVQRRRNDRWHRKHRGYYRGEGRYNRGYGRRH